MFEGWVLFAGFAHGGLLSVGNVVLRQFGLSCEGGVCEEEVGAE